MSHVGRNRPCYFPVPLRAARRFQSFLGGPRPISPPARGPFSHPLAPPDPAARNIALPRAFHRPRGAEAPPAALQKRAQQALLRQLQQEVLWEGAVLDQPEHHLIRHFLKLHGLPRYRQARGMMVVGGKEMLRELCGRGFAPRHLLLTAGKPLPEWAARLRETAVVRVAPSLASTCAPGNDGYLGDFDIPPPPLKERLIANPHRLRRVLVLDNVDDPGVLGAVLRTAVGFQYDAVIATNHCADLYDHRVVRAARGVHFQDGVPLYTLQEEDGDDVYGMLNHVIERNNLLPLAFSPQEDHPSGLNPAGQGVFVSSVVGAAPVAIPARGISPPIDHAPPRESLSAFALNRFARHADGKDRGYLLIAGPNHTRNLMQRLARRVGRPTTQLLLDSMPPSPDLLLSLSIVLHELRPNGHWDYMPVDEKHEASSMALQTRRASVEIGPNRLSLDARSLSLDERAQIQLADTRNAFKKWQRLHKRKKGDYEMWMDAETARVQALQQNEMESRLFPFDSRRHRKTGLRGAKGMPGWVPNIVDEYRMPLDRDRLRKEREWAETFTRPPNYFKKEAKHPPTSTT
ncbi:unnamed protein product [Phytomonas sp. Hart1]|nr:unnamed protein product [Phytomonas sp. Hart1]|eukprot:CCW69471.1 unnamed protein product [Phytomonas sp. isolate Hart1]